MFTVIGLLVACGLAPFPAQAMALSLSPDPAIRQGQLSNGLRYAVISHPAPKGALSLRLAIAVGSYDEQDDERGVAHFVEHMAFNGTRRFGEDEVERVFAPLGVGFGRDHNAFTSLSGTSFHIDLQSVAPEQVDPALRWLRDAADGMLFAPEAVDRERGVILAERESRIAAGDGWRERLSDFAFRDLRSNRRQPIGDVEIIRTVTADRLKAFYDRWYRPENALVIAVGDLPPERLEALVRTTFADWQGRGPAGVRIAREGPKGERGLDYLFDVDPQAPYAASACRLQAARPAPGSADAFRASATEILWMNVLNARLAARRGPAILFSNTSADGLVDLRRICVQVTPVPGRLAEALAIVKSEVARFERDGPTDAELDAAIAEVRSGYRGLIAEEPTVRAPARADTLMRELLEGLPSPAAREGMRAFNQLVEGVTTADVKAAFQTSWSGWGPLVAVTSTEVVDQPAVRAAWEQGATAAAPATSAKAKAEPTWPYVRFGPEGKLVRREEITAPGFTRLHFSNGVTVNFRRTRFKGGEVLVRVKFGAGRRELRSADYQTALFGAIYLEQGGLGRISYTDIQALTRTMAWSLDLNIRERAFELDGATFSTGLEAQLNLFAAYLTDPGFQPILNSLAPVLTDQALRATRAEPSDVMMQGFGDAIAPDSPTRLDPAAARGARNTDFARVLRPILTRAPITVSVVGDVDEAAVIEAVSRTLGAIPPRRGGDRARSDTWFRQFPDRLPPPSRLTHEGAADKAIVGLFWPLFVGAPERRREEVALRLLSAVFEDGLRRGVRERMGMSYAPEAGAAMWDGGDQGYLWTSVETSPRDVERVEAEVRALAARLARGEISQAELEAARTPVLASWRSFEDDNSWWLDLLSASDRPAELAALTGARDLISAITLDEVRAAATRWLAAEPVVVTAEPTAPKDPKA
ncbi:pitrilysin family protein [Phenylobacterium sp. J367]|uniref:M16 family metallopeptidase n=1 Tax=Phenylobacterium sp. J367 TaxID=2898435 RepID=UPI0021517C89|nr:M16 family metallopeptidase [Phenylobacterium sp. J367]MCR5880059.1 insulinase family protein [Phenylobacterium sp. J367]